MFFSDLKYGLTGHWHNQTMPYYPNCDTKENYEKSCVIKSESWFYYNNPIEYKFNSYGFRCDNFDELSEDYLLFTGCSLTEGIGLHVEHTYPYIVSRKLNKTYFNLALGGSGPDIVKHNLIMFLSHLEKDKLPKYVIIQWPDFNRISMLGTDFKWFNINAWSGNIFKELYYNELPEYTNIFNRYITLEFLKTIGIKNIIEIGSFGNKFFVSESAHCEFALWRKFEDDLARDLGHPGINAHKAQAEEILNILNKM